MTQPIGGTATDPRRYFYDLEFLEDGRTIDLISIGIVADDGREYYAVNSDAPMDRIRANDWLVRNVLPSLPIGGRTSLDTYVARPVNTFPRAPLDLVDLDRRDIQVRPRWVIANEVREFLWSGAPDRQECPIELWAYYGAYDHVALCQLWGTMMQLPDGIPMWTNDIMQAAAGRALPEQPYGHHNALDDARHVRTMWEHLQ
ncbi:hypothetical protein AB0B88_16355 [Micromonospora haikouensis]|uniref:hypothetical protein n=1 Tax=Micromonospora haikouensis TaxID=686309 RepID=UPI003403923F